MSRQDRRSDEMTAKAGLCEACIFARVVESARGSRFYLCKRSETDGRFAKYPALPVLACVGYETLSEEADVTEL